MASAGTTDEATQRLMAEMALPCVVRPILVDLEKRRDSSSPAVLKDAFDSVESFYPGFTDYFISGILQKAGIDQRIDMSEAVLKLEGSGQQQSVMLRRGDPVFKNLQQRARSLKTILGRIPAEISDRKKFLDTIKDIAQAIKHLLDAVNEVFVHVHSTEERTNLERRKKEFVKYSKRFSTTLKEFFKDNKDDNKERRGAVYTSANHLIHQTNHILLAVF